MKISITYKIKYGCLTKILVSITWILMTKQTDLGSFLLIQDKRLYRMNKYWSQICQDYIELGSTNTANTKREHSRVRTAYKFTLKKVKWPHTIKISENIQISVHRNINKHKAEKYSACSWHKLGHWSGSKINTSKRKEWINKMIMKPSKWEYTNIIKKIFIFKGFSLILLTQCILGFMFPSVEDIKGLSI